jgi:predicted outer membrane repeat protein
VTLTNNTVSGNSAFEGGGIYSDGIEDEPVTATIEQHGRVQLGHRAGRWHLQPQPAPGGFVHLTNSLVAKNTEGLCRRGQDLQVLGSEATLHNLQVGR